MEKKKKEKLSKIANFKHVFMTTFFLMSAGERI